ncbi:MAG TPA: hypothetical protein VI248_07845 [Kineosporiaceae bacterium]
MIQAVALASPGALAAVSSHLSPPQPGGPAPRRRRIGPRAAGLLLGLGALIWALLWTTVAWAVWQNGVDDRHLTEQGRPATGVVAGVVHTAADKLGYCRQVLRVTSRAGGGSLTVPATRPCTDLWQPGDPIRIMLDGEDPPRAVVATEALDRVATHALPVLVVALSAVLAGYPLGQWAARRDSRAAPT